MNLPDVQAPESGSKNFLKLKDGESVKVIFCGEMHHFYQKWFNGKPALTDNKDPDGKIRFRNNVACTDANGEVVMKLFDFSWSVFEKIKEINEEWNGIETVKIKITRNGIGTETEYHLTPLREPLSPSVLNLIKSLPLLPLEKKGSAPKNSVEFDADTVPF